MMKTEMMTLEEAFEKAGNNDIIKRNCWKKINRTKREMIDEPEALNLSVEAAIAHDWQIIPAEPSVLDAGEIRYLVIKELESINIPDSSMILEAAELGIESGKKSQWLHLEPIIKGVIATCGIAGESSPLAKNIKKQLENLKPIEEK